jgi:predicted esterase
MTLNRTLLVLLAASLAWACDQDSGGWPDGTTDVVVDTPVETGMDVIEESVPDAVEEPVDDPVTDTGGTYDGVPGEFTQTFNARNYRMYVPGAYSHSTPIPVVIGFHGAGDTGSNFYAFSASAGWTAAADAGPFILIVPDTKSPYSDFAVWSGDPMDDFDEMFAEMSDILDLVADVGIHYNLDTESFYAFGFSDGGLFLGVAGFQYASDFAGLVVAGYGWGGFYAVDPSWLIPVYMICGSADSFYTYAEDTRTFLSSQGHPLEWVPVSGAGHSFGSLMSARSPTTIYGWLSTH